MIMRDLHNHIHTLPGIAPQVITDNTAAVSAIIDRRGYGALEFVITSGTLSDADTTVTALLEESDDSGMSGATAVADADMLGTEAEASLTFADDGETRKLGYIGTKRYVRLTMTPANNTGNIPIAAVVIMGKPSIMATANPPQ